MEETSTPTWSGDGHTEVPTEDKTTETPTVEDVETETPTADEGWKGDGTETPTVTIDESSETPTAEDGWKGDGHLGRQKGW